MSDLDNEQSFVICLRIVAFFFFFFCRNEVSGKEYILDAETLPKQSPRDSGTGVYL